MLVTSVLMSIFGASPQEFKMKNVLLCFEVITIFLSIFAAVANCAPDKYRVCVVEGAKSKKIAKWCPLLDKTDSKVKCVISSNRLDCLMKISDGQADFTVLEAEDIVVASNTRNTNILVTNNIRFYPERLFAYEMVAIVRNTADITDISDLQGMNLCHPGNGNEQYQWTEVISRFFEARVVPQICNTSLTLAENRIKSSASYFKAACKAGPWVPNYTLDSKLKNKYPNLCELCDNPYDCSTRDKYWGRQGSLFCLTDGAGDVAWARLDDTKGHFGLNESDVTPMGNPNDYSYLCPNGTRQPITSQADPCVWLARPWPSIVASKASASGVQNIVSNLADHLNVIGWQKILYSLLAFSFSESITQLPTMETAEDYLQEATGFTSANSLSDCTPGRPIRVCTSSGDEFAKCGWLKEASKAFGIEPDLSCLQAKSPQDCMKVVQKEAADVVIVKADQQLIARRDYDLQVMMYEFSNNVENLYNAAAVVKINSSIKKFEDLRGRKACFPSYEGVAWTSLVESLKNKTMLPKTCPYSKAVGEFFSDSCVPGLQKSSPDFQPSLRSLCKDDLIDPLLVTNDADKYSGEAGAFRCLVNGGGDVAFIDLATIRNNTDGANKEEWAINLKSNDFESLCLDNSTKKCYMSWATPGQIMIKVNTSALRTEELLVSFLNLDNLFGKHYKTQTPAFQLYAPFEGKQNIMFNDATHRLEDYDSVKRDGLPIRNYEEMIRTTPKCSSGSNAVIVSIGALLLSMFIILVRV